MIVYLADLAHDYLPARQFVPLGIGYLASYSKSIFGEKVEFHLFKSVDKLLDLKNNKSHKKLQKIKCRKHFCQSKRAFQSS